jgi:hypothetical protein
MTKKNCWMTLPKTKQRTYNRENMWWYKHRRKERKGNTSFKKDAGKTWLYRKIESAKSSVMQYNPETKVTLKPATWNSECHTTSHLSLGMPWMFDWGTQSTTFWCIIIWIYDISACPVSI